MCVFLRCSVNLMKMMRSKSCQVGFSKNSKSPDKTELNRELQCKSSTCSYEDRSQQSVQQLIGEVFGKKPFLEVVEVDEFSL